MTARTSPADLRARRIALGASEEIMATGIGLSLAEFQELERGAASDLALSHYADWLTSMEQWSSDHRERQYLRARTGFLFVRANQTA